MTTHPHSITAEEFAYLKRRVADEKMNGSDAAWYVEQNVPPYVAGYLSCAVWKLTDRVDSDSEDFFAQMWGLLENFVKKGQS